MWKEVTVFTTNDGLDIVAGRFDMLGVTQLEINEGLAGVAGYLNEAASFWDYADPDELTPEMEPFVRAYIADVPENAEIIEAVAPAMDELGKMDMGVDLGSLRIEERLVSEEDWANNWKAYYKPLEIGERLVVRPSWEAIGDTDRVVLSLDPGMAFGTGTHQTTRLCLEFLERLVKNGDEMLDLGCGSGILSIAGLLLGASHAIAVDIDPIVETIAAENAAMNGIKDEYRIMTGDILSDDGIKREISKQRYDIVTANIVASVIIKLAPQIPALLKDDGVFIASGIILERLDEVKDALANNGLKVLEVKKLDEWSALTAVKERE